MKSYAAIYDSFGKASEVLKIKEIELPEIKSNEALVKLIRAVVNPSDMGMIGGSYGKLKTLPAVAGREGIGEVIALGDSCKSLKIGDYVRMPEDLGAWQSHIIYDESKLFKIPNDIDPNDACMAFINPPTALCVLREFCKLEKGDYIIQNGAGSALGYFMIQLCKHYGFKTINMLRNAKGKEASLKAIGADIVIDESEFDAKKLKEICKSPIKLGLNQIGGESISNMIKAVSDGAPIVTIGAMTGDAVRFPTRFLIFNDISLRGFWWDKWQRTHDSSEIFNEIFSLMRAKKLKAPVDKIFALSDITSAMLAAEQSSRQGKILLKA